MMNEVENVQVKREFEAQQQCRACLSVGRKLISIGMYAGLFEKLVSEDFDPVSTKYLKVCWECYGLLHKVSQFQQKVEKASELLQLGQHYFYGTLSSLSTITINNDHLHTIYINRQTDVMKSESYNKTYIDNDNMNVENDMDIDTKDFKEDCVSSTQTHGTTCKEELNSSTDKKPKSVSRWAKLRAEENRKPKYKLINKEDVKNIYKVIYMKFEEVRDSSTKNAKYKCPICKLRIELRSEYLNHVCNFHGENQCKFVCDICTLSFKDKRHLSSHIKKHYSKYECTICQYSCLSNKTIIKHVNNDHKQIYKCLKCGLMFGCKEFHDHHRDRHERFTCDHCGVSFKMRYCIEEHIKKQHSKFECVLCKKQFARYNGLWLHNKTRHAASYTAAYCVECDKRFPDIYRYRWHLANSVKHKLKPNKKVRIPCSECNKVFSKKIYMTEHYNLVHLKVYKYRCEGCNKNYLRNADLVNHRKRVHEGILPPKNKICYMCGRGFTTNKMLSNHVRTHTGERPFACAHCPAAFTQAAARDKHERSVHRDLGPAKQ